ncbi:MAG: arginine--tRNA ligase, partial [Lachnoclostridium sp.]|nr:arginine--tRNA ligase [Lachnoclostridium sp.]
MKSILEILNDKVETAFTKAGYDKKYGFVRNSNRPDLCEFQCSGAMAAAKEYKTGPIEIANKVTEILKNDRDFSMVSVVKPGFINLNVDSLLLSHLVGKMREDDKFGLNPPKKEMTIIVDYGGANVAKALHVGHLRPAIIGESVKRIGRFMGHKVIGDVHLGDWGLQIGLIITELRHRQPKLSYFDSSFQGEYPKEPPFTISDLEEIYPYASARSKEDEEYKKEAQEATAGLQSGDPAFRAIWQHIVDVSIADLKSNYQKLNVDFDLWKKESDAEPFIPDMIKDMKEQGVAYVSEGALVVDVSEEGDKKELPPCLIVKSNGATLYATTDLATIIERMKLFNPDLIIYITDKRQALHFTQVFRTAKKAKLTHEDTEFIFIGHGTMNGKDGKPFKTRDGGLLRLETLIEQINEEVRQKMK